MSFFLISMKNTQLSITKLLRKMEKKKKSPTLQNLILFTFHHYKMLLCSNILIILKQFFQATSTVGNWLKMLHSSVGRYCTFLSKAQSSSAADIWRISPRKRELCRFGGGGCWFLLTPHSFENALVALTYFTFP